jgi:hypothetical protein
MIVSLIIRAVQSSVNPRSDRVETASSNLHLVGAICVIGLLATLCGILRFPELGAVVTQYNQF